MIVEIKLSMQNKTKKEERGPNLLYHIAIGICCHHNYDITPFCGRKEKENKNGDIPQ